MDVYFSRGTSAVGGPLLVGIRFANHRAEFFGAGIEAAYAARPSSEAVSLVHRVDHPVP
jgi:hypothetical protein